MPLAFNTPSTARFLFKAVLMFDHSQIQSITIWSTGDADAPDLLRMVTIDMGHIAFFTIRRGCFVAGLDHAHACSSC